MSAQISLRGMLRLIRVDTLRRVRNIDLLMERFSYALSTRIKVAMDEIFKM